jgi:hypothetical protein
MTGNIEDNKNGHGGWYKKVINRHGLILYFNEHNQLHRTDGPAKLYEFNPDFKEWWFENENITKKLILWAFERDIDILNLSDEDNIIIKTEFFGFYLKKSKNSC